MLCCSQSKLLLLSLLARLPSLAAQVVSNINYILPEVQDVTLNTVPESKAIAKPTPHRYIDDIESGSDHWILEHWYFGIAMAFLSVAILFGLCKCHIRWVKRHKQEQQKQHVFTYLQQFDVHDVDLRKSPPGGWHGTYLNRLAYGINSNGCGDKVHHFRKYDDTVTSSKEYRLPYGNEDGGYSFIPSNQRRKERLALTTLPDSPSSSSDEGDLSHPSNTPALAARYPTISLLLDDPTGAEPKLGDVSSKAHYSKNDDDDDGFEHDALRDVGTNSSDEMNSSTEDDYYVATAAKEVV